MCRLCGITFNNMPMLDIIDRFMLLNQLDEGQFDGCGITNGKQVTRSVMPYSHTVLQHFDDGDGGFDLENGIVGHVRKASPQTGKTRDESHPFTFLIGDKPLIGAHNGYFVGSGWSKKDEPNSDSWRAFSKLAEILRDTDDQVLSKDVFETWLSNYEEGSLIGLLIMYDGYIYAYRHNKPLYMADFGNGYVINTGARTIVLMAEYIRQRRWGDVPELDPVEIPSDTLLRMKPCTKMFHMDQLNVQFKPKTVYNNGYVGNKSDTTTTATPVVSGGSKKVDTASLPNATPAQVPLLGKPAAGEDSTKVDSNISRVVMAVKATANPMRASLWLGWLQASYGITIPNHIDTMFETITEADFQLFRTSVGKWTKRQSRLIQAWNKTIPKGPDKMQDIEFHLDSFGVDWFWMDDAFLDDTLTDDQAVELLIRCITGSEAYTKYFGKDTE